MRTQIENKRGETRVTKSSVGFSFATDWMRGWREFSGPITGQSLAKPKQSRFIFDTEFKFALKPRWSHWYENRLYILKTFPTNAVHCITLCPYKHVLSCHITQLSFFQDPPRVNFAPTRYLRILPRTYWTSINVSKNLKHLHLAFCFPLILVDVAKAIKKKARCF